MLFKSPHKYPLKIETLENGPVSHFVSTFGLLMAITLTVYTLIRILFEAILIPRWYPTHVSQLDQNRLRGFINHQMALLAKIIAFAISIYPFVSIIFGPGDFDTRWNKNGKATFGDTITIGASIFMGIYIHELLYRSHLNWQTLVHHFFTVISGTTAITLTTMWQSRPFAKLYFALVMIYGVSTMIRTLPSHSSIIALRFWPHKHKLLARFYSVTFCVSLMGTLMETTFVLFLLGWCWYRWNDQVKVTTPIIHGAFLVAQVWTIQDAWRRWRTEKRKMGNCEHCRLSAKAEYRWTQRASDEQVANVV
ncbi:hypothetical protein BDV95DRAFT_480274 [Massariosphaeria phaeospora]|uniref:TLC domain-containing protein n=1 Tax=Massariosphaeria phaeospora TaxID=100035 RepID=A0A7C8MHQ8_9PLEO|nr:hypothetical protein BDV95DRAFT_480274 [Massariosphaeria phaeospora]